MKTIRFWLGLILVVLFSFVCGAVAFGDEQPAADVPVATVPSDVKPAPFMPGVDAELSEQSKLFDGDKRKGDKGLKPIDPREKFSLPSPFSIAGRMVGVVLEIGVFLLQLAIIALVVWVIVRAAKRHHNTGTVIPAKGEKSVFDVFDDIVTDLKTRRADREAEVAEIDKRLPRTQKTAAKAKAK
jgi:hypothetical protein